MKKKNQNILTLIFTCILMVTFICAGTLNAATSKYRLTVRDNGANSMVVCWTDDDGDVGYGTVDHGTDYDAYPNKFTASQTVDKTEQGMNHHFARLSGLTPDTVYYFVIRSNGHLSPRMSFKTLPTNSGFTMITGGDSRSNAGPRRDGNRLVSKLRPSAIIFCGDFINSNSQSSWSEWLEDWQLTRSSDGRMQPIIPVLGNHESYDKGVITGIFDSKSDYFTVELGDMMVASLVSDGNLGPQATWLQSELINHSDKRWRVTAYHKPMRVHSTSKSDGNDVYDAFADLFYDYKVQLSVDGDTHTCKTTYPVRPVSGGDDGFVRDDENGTVYAGEGCWGAPLRSYNKARSWTRRGGSFNQFKWINVLSHKMVLRTVKFENVSNVAEVTDDDPYAKPSGIVLFGNDVDVNDTGLTPNDSQFVSQDVPTAMLPGQTEQVSITIRNTGADAWSSASGHNLGAQNPQDNELWRDNRVSLSGTVEPDASHTFNFDITAPTDPGIYNFQWRMLDEAGDNTGWFGARTDNITINVGNLIDATAPGGTVTSNGVNVPAAEGPEKAFDDDVNTKFLSFSTSAYLQYHFSGGPESIKAVTLTSANDRPERDPLDVILSGSNDGLNWVTVGSANGLSFGSRFEKQAFNVTNNNSYSYYRVEMSNNNAEALLQVADVELLVQGNYAPTIDSQPDPHVDASSNYSYTITANDYEGDTIAFSATVLPAWLSFNASSALLSGIPSTADIGSHNVTLRADDGSSFTEQSFVINVSGPGNDLPEIISSPEMSVTVNGLYSYTLTATDADGDLISYSASVLPAWLSFDSSSGVLSGTPSSSDLGLNLVTLTVDDGQGGSVYQPFNIAVFAPSDAAWDFTTSNATPVPAGWTSWATGPGTSSVVGGLTLTHNSGGSVIGQSTPALITESGTALLTANAGVLNDYIKLDGDAASFTLSGLGVGEQVRFQFTAHCKTSTAGTRNLTVSINGGPAQNLFSPGGTTGGDEATYSPHFSYTGTGADVSFVFTQVNNGAATGVSGMIVEGLGAANNTPPLIVSIPELSAEVGVEYSYTLLAEDAQGDDLTFTAPTLPSWLSFDPASGILSGTAGASDAGGHSVSLSASDGSGSDTQAFTVTVNSSGTVYDDWKIVNVITDDDADEDGDGISNFAEFALGGDPNDATEELIAPRVSDNGSNIDFKFKRAESSVTYIVEKSEDLINWETHATIDDTHGTVGNEATVSIPVSSMSDGKMFLRLRANNN